MHGDHRAKHSAASKIHVQGASALKSTVSQVQADWKQNRSFVMLRMYSGKDSGRAWHHHTALNSVIMPPRKGKQNSLLAHRSGPSTLKLFPPTRFVFFFFFFGSPPCSSTLALITSAGPAQVKEHIFANKVVSNRGGVQVL